MESTKLRLEKAIQELKDLNKDIVTDMEYFCVWSKYVQGDINMLRFKEILAEHNIKVEDRY